jgi:hypothetical protein
MYLQSFEERPAATGQDRRRFPRVKPDQLGRFKAEEFTSSGYETAARAARSSWLIALGGAVVGAIINTMVMGHSRADRPVNEPVEALAFSPNMGRAELKRANRHDSPSPTAARKQPPQPQREDLLPRPVAAQPPRAMPIPSPDAGVAAADSIALAEGRERRPMAQRDTVAGPRLSRSIAVVPIDREGAMVPMAGPEDEDRGLEVMQ